MDKRRFRRTHFDVDCVLQRGDSTLQLQLVNVSLKGVLVKTPAESTLPVGTDGTLLIRLKPSPQVIRAEVELVHREVADLGFRIVSIDVDSITHLRRLIEMNTGSDVDEKELAFLRDEPSR